MGERVRKDTATIAYCTRCGASTYWKPDRAGLWACDGRYDSHKNTTIPGCGLRLTMDDFHHARKAAADGKI